MKSQDCKIWYIRRIRYNIGKVRHKNRSANRFDQSEINQSENCIRYNTLVLWHNKFHKEIRNDEK